MRVLLLAVGAFGLWYYFGHRRAENRGPRRTGGRHGNRQEGRPITRVTYQVVEHDGGWAYKVGDVFSETHATRAEAANAAEQAAAAHRSAGADAFIEYQDRRGRWHEELEPGEDRPQTDVERRPRD